MVFASPIFLFLFLPLFLAVYYPAPFRLKSAVIVLGSSIFYAWWRADFLLLLYGIIFWSWGIALLIEKYRDRDIAVWLLRIGIIANILTLAYFKYWNFGINSFHAIMIKAGFPPPSDFIHVILPIGISFFVFHAISYIVDVWRRDAMATKNLLDFAAFIMLFPHLIAGPVLRYKDLAPQFESRPHNFALFSEGALRFMSGFAKKVLIADTVAPLADAAFAIENPSMADAWLGVVAYAVQLFFDFAGYSEMAVGLALMMGFRFIENFDHPYISRSITEFWRRWHISLSTWLRDYLYIPLGGNRKGRIRTYFNLFLTMLLGGLWHGANWTFVLWGAWHGILLAAERLKSEFFAPSSQPSSRWGEGVKLVYCTLAVLIGWVLFRSPDIAAAAEFYKGMGGMYGTVISDALAWQIKSISLCALGAGVALVYILPVFDRYRTPVKLAGGSIAMESHPPAAVQIIVCGFFLLAVSRLIAMSYSPFLYFQF